MTISVIHFNKEVTETVKSISAKDDTSAFVRGCQLYWIEKLVAKEFNKKFEGMNVTMQPLPFHFSVESTNRRTVSFEPDVAERITKEIIDDFSKKMADVDTITPFIKRPKERTPNIY